MLDPKWYPSPQKWPKMKTPFFFAKNPGLLQPSTPSTGSFSVWISRTLKRRFTRRIQGRNRTSAFASFVAPRWILQTEAARGPGGWVGFGRFSAFGRCFASHQSVTLQSARKGFSRFLFCGFFLVFAYWPSLKRTANAPENRQMVKEIPIGNPHFWGAMLVSRTVHFQVVIVVYRYIHSRLFNYIYSMMYTVYEYTCTKWCSYTVWYILILMHMHIYI